MSEVALLPFSSKENTIFELFEGIFTGTGEVIAPFEMINISDQSFFSDKVSQGFQIFVSNKPLNRGLYWIMFIKTPSILNLRYFQSDIMFSESEFEIYFRTCNKPLILQNIQTENKIPYETMTQVLRIGKIKDSKLVTNLNLYGNDFLTIDRTLTIDECDKLIVAKNEFSKGVDLNVLYSNR